MDFFDTEEVRKEIKWAKAVLKKEDKIIWYLRLYRQAWLLNIDHPNAKAFVQKQARKFSYLAISVRLPNQANIFDILKERLQHFMDLDAHHINNMSWNNIKHEELIAMLHLLEREWIAKAKRKVDEYGEVFLTVGEYTWFNLLKSGCSTEGRAMGHCGNGSGKKGQTVYSLRSKTNDGKWTPHVTLVLNECDDHHTPGYTSEIKGFGNQKPRPEYHEALVAFMLSDRVTGMEHMGYLAQNNFALTDLPENQFRQLYTQKPSIFNFQQHFYMSKGKRTLELENAFATSIERYKRAGHKILHPFSFNVRDKVNELLDRELEAFKDTRDSKLIDLLSSRISLDIDEPEYETYISENYQLNIQLKANKALDYILQSMSPTSYKKIDVELNIDSGNFKQLCIPKIIREFTEDTPDSYHENHRRAAMKLNEAVKVRRLSRSERDWIIDTYKNRLPLKDAAILLKYGFEEQSYIDKLWNKALSISNINPNNPLGETRSASEVCVETEGRLNKPMFLMCEMTIYQFLIKCRMHGAIRTLTARPDILTSTTEMALSYKEELRHTIESGVNSKYSVFVNFEKDKVLAYIPEKSVQSFPKDDAYQLTPDSNSDNVIVSEVLTELKKQMFESLRHQHINTDKLYRPDFTRPSDLSGALAAFQAVGQKVNEDLQKEKDSKRFNFFRRLARS